MQTTLFACVEWKAMGMNREFSSFGDRLVKLYNSQTPLKREGPRNVDVVYSYFY